MHDASGRASESYSISHCLILNKTLRIWSALTQPDKLASKPQASSCLLLPQLGSQAHTTVLDFLCGCWWENASPHAYMKNIWLNEASTELQISFLFGDKDPLIAKAGLALPNDSAVSASENWDVHHPTRLRFIFFGGEQYVYFQNGNLPLEHTGIIILESILLREKTDTSWLLWSSSITSVESV